MSGMAVVVLLLGWALLLPGMVVLGLWLWARRQVAALRAEVMAAPGVARALPEAVREMALRCGAEAGGRAVVLTQRAEIRREQGGDWAPLRARQWIGVGAPGFVWEAGMRAGPLTGVRVVDAFAGGRGVLKVWLYGAFPVAEARGAEIDRSEAMRYLAELPWAPDAVLGNGALRWRVLEGGDLAVSLELAGGPAEVVLERDAAGDIGGIRAVGRPAMSPGGRLVERPWEGRFWEWGEIGGRRVPRRAEVGWVYEDGYEAYWRGEVTGYRVV